MTPAEIKILCAVALAWTHEDSQDIAFKDITIATLRGEVETLEKKLLYRLEMEQILNLLWESRGKFVTDAACRALMDEFKTLFAYSVST